MENKEAKKEGTQSQEATQETKNTVTIIVQEPFRDKYDTTVVYKVDSELEVDPERAKDIVDRKLGRYVEPIA